MDIFEDKSDYRESVINSINNSNLCKEYIDYINNELNKKEKIEKVIDEIDEIKVDFGNSKSNNAFVCGLYAGAYIRIANIIKSDK